MRIEVRCGRELTASDREKIEAFFSARYADAAFEYVADPALIGGFVAVCGDEVYDASVASKLARLRAGLFD